MYTQQVVIGTGKTNWTSRIEDEKNNFLVKGLKTLLGRGGEYNDVRAAGRSRIASRFSAPVEMAETTNGTDGK